MIQLRIPGPTPCPDDVLKAVGRQMINHRGKEFGEILSHVTMRLKEMFQTQNDVFVLTASGTGAMEAAVVNMLSPGDKALVVSIGAFGDRFGEESPRPTGRRNAAQLRVGTCRGPGRGAQGVAGGRGHQGGPADA